MSACQRLHPGAAGDRRWPPGGCLFVLLIGGAVPWTLVLFWLLS
jgi:hypothetical protein